MFDYTCELRVHEPGPFEAEIVLNVFDRDIRQLQLCVRGVGVDAKGSNTNVSGK